MVFKKVALYWRTLRFLRPIQILGRVRYKLMRPRPDMSRAPSINSVAGAWKRPAQRSQSLFGPSSFLFLGKKCCLDDIGWDNPKLDKLWRYNQHYFDDLNALDAVVRYDWHCDLVDRWIAENPPGKGSGWEPYPTSLRIVNWVKWYMSGVTPKDKAIQSLAVQARWLTRKLEWHLLGNHLFANAKALLFVGLFFEGDESDEWLRLGAQILIKELPEQILSDGGHFELSPMYHSLALEDLLDLINILHAVSNSGNEVLIKMLEDRVESMISWLAAMSHPDDKIAFFNDAAFGIAPDNSELRYYAQRLGFQSPPAPAQNLWPLIDSGYIRSSSAFAVLIADVGEVGPSYLPGHAHADTLSFECSVFGRRIIVNSGTSVYGNDKERLRQRGTAAHSTVVVCNEDSSEVWGGFRVARRAHILRRSYKCDETAMVVEAAHDGYTRLVGGLTHSRIWRLSDNVLTVIDEIGEGGSEEARAIFHIHPDVLVEQETERSGSIRIDDGRVIRWISETDMEVVDGSWHPEFGKSLSNCCLVIPLVDGKSKFELFW